MFNFGLKLNRFIRESFKLKALKAFFVCICMFSILTSDKFFTNLYAQTLQQSMQYYFRGDLNGTENSLNATLRNKISDKDRSQAYKYLGIVQFMKGKKDPAANSFRNALRINPKLGISASEALDESVIPFFNSVKADKSKYAAKAAPKQSTAARAPRAASVPATASVAASGSSMRSVANKAKRTTLFIKCNVRSASVMIGGILAGTVNSVLDVNPGKQKLEISSPGYITKRITVNIVKNNENSINIDLAKPQPKPKPQPVVPKASRVAKTSRSSDVSGSSSRMDYQEDYSSQSSQNSYYGAQSAPSMQPQVPQNPYQPYTPSNQYVPNMYQAAPVYTTPVTPVAPVAPVYQYPTPVYQAPMYQAVPQAPSYTPPQQNTYGYQQPRSTSSPADVAPLPDPAADLSSPPSPPSSDSYTDSVSYSDFNVDDKPVKKKAAKKVKKSKKTENVSYYFDDPGSSKGYTSYGGSSKKKKKSSSSLGISRFLPFGVPQFIQGKILWGTIFVVAQAGGLGWGIYNYIQYQDCVKNCQKQIDDLNNQGTYEAESLQAYADYLEEQKQNNELHFYIGIGVFAGAWVVGIIETFLNPPRATSKKSAYIVEKNTFHLLAGEEDTKDPYLRSTESVILDEIAQETSELEDLYSYKSSDILTEDKPKSDSGIELFPIEQGDRTIPIVGYKFSL